MSGTQAIPLGISAPTRHQTVTVTILLDYSNIAYSIQFYSIFYYLKLHTALFKLERNIRIRSTEYSTFRESTANAAKPQIPSPQTC